MSTPPSRHSVESATPLAAPDLIVFSHLRWSWVWQRPQQLISRLATSRRTWFIEEPFVDQTTDRPTMRWSSSDGVTIGRLHVPGPVRHVGFDAPEFDQLVEAVRAAADGEVPVMWLYTPLALEAARAVPHRTLIFDVMDDLASFKDASPQLHSLHRRLLDEADIVFTGGRSLHNDVIALRPDNSYLFPSGVDTHHYAHAMAVRQRCDQPTAGYVGVIDERLDLALIAGVADLLPSWRILMVGPVAKIDAADLPRKPNIEYVGAVSYDELPDTMARFDVALMPFALNEATRSISPTKTLEYLAAGLPVVSTRVPDVVHDFADLVRLADDAEHFADACIQALGDANDAEYHTRCRPVLDWRHWDRIAARMTNIINECERSVPPLERSA